MFEIELQRGLSISFLKSLALPLSTLTGFFTMFTIIFENDYNQESYKNGGVK